jgi:outer membrane protein assembly factor BamB
MTSARVHRRRVLVAAVLTVALLSVAWWQSSSARETSTGAGGVSPSSGSAGLPVADAATGPGRLAPGSDPSVLPAPVLIADKLNNRLVIVDPHGRQIWQFPRPGDLAAGQTFRIPDDAFFSPDGRDIIATQEDNQVVSVIDIARHRIIWRYGHPGVAGSGPNRLHNPDDAILMPGGRVVLADIKNCRLAETRVGLHRLTWTRGTDGMCTHLPSQDFGSPNGMFPLGHGRFLVTEINGDWVDEITSTGRVLWSTHPPGVTYPSDTNRYGPNSYLTVDYSRPGQIVLFNRAGARLWRFAPTGRAALAKPSLALPLPNGDIIATDDANDRVIVVDPHTHRIVWQYGHRGRAGRKLGYLSNPDGLDLMPPYNYIHRVLH